MDSSWAETMGASRPLEHNVTYVTQAKSGSAKVPEKRTFLPHYYICGVVTPPLAPLAAFRVHPIFFPPLFSGGGDFAGKRM